MAHLNGISTCVAQLEEAGEAGQTEAAGVGLHQRFEWQAARRPWAVAVVDAAAQLTYAELNHAANRLARHLRLLGVGPEMMVGICLERSHELIIAILAVLKAGGAYVPLDPDYPAERLAFIVRDAALSVVITKESLPDGLPVSEGCRIVSLNAECDVIGAHGTADLAIEVDPGGLLYVIYTSGSTGQPKGVLVTHRNVVRLFDELGPVLALSAKDAWSFYHSPAFGYSAWEIWGALVHGGRLVIVPPAARMSPAALCDLLRKEEVSVLSLTPSAFRQVMLDAAFESAESVGMLRMIALSGEGVVGADLRRWFANHREGHPEIVDTYAITETGGQVAWRRLGSVDAESDACNLLGELLSDTRVHLLDDNLQPVEPGTDGELCVSGPGLARGYWNRRELSEERFVRDPRDPEQRFYRTGDRGRMRPDGRIALMGRGDDQIKVRGFRVELGEIESALREHPKIREAAVVLRQDDGLPPRLVAYLAARRPERAAVRAAGQGAGEAELWPSLGEYQVYDEVLYYFMTSEEVRNAAYKEAIKRHVRDKVVLDIGTGQDAILARFCVEAGAKRVYATEVLDEAYEKAARLVRESGLSDRIIVIHGDSTTVQLPEPVDVCTEGIIGNIGSSDGIIPIMNDARRWFAPNAIPIPRRCTTFFAAVELPDSIYHRPSFSSMPKHYAERVFNQAGRRFDIRLCVRNFPDSQLISGAATFEDLDFSDHLDPEFSGETEFTITRNARFDGLLLWTHVLTTEGVAVDYLQNQQAWLPVYFPLGDDGIKVQVGDRIQASWRRTLCGNGLNPDYSIRATVNRSNGKQAEFTYQTKHHETAYLGTGIHRKLFAHWDRPSLDLSLEKVRTYLDKRLPDYMIPSAFVFLDELPRNANGKLDRAALPPPDNARPAFGTAYLAPGNRIERDLARIWQNVLGINYIGVEDNFFELGGNSLQAISISSQIQRILKEPVYVVAIFDAPTIAQLADFLLKHYPRAMAAAFPAEFPARQSPVFEAQEHRKITAADLETLQASIKPLVARRALRAKGSKNPPAAFILSTHRSGSTLLRIMLAGHPALFAPPELELLSFDSLAQRRQAFSGRDAYWLEGTVRALMQIRGCSAQEAWQIMADCEREDLPVPEFYRLLQDGIGHRILVDKSTHYALNLETLRQAEEQFENPLYLHLLRHPCGSIHSYVDTRMEFFFRYRHSFSTPQLAELNWLISQQNILALLEHVPSHRQHRVRFEDLVAAPQAQMEKICRFLGIDFHPGLLHPYEDAALRMTDPIQPQSKMLGDIKFATHHTIDPQVAHRWKGHVSEDSLGELTWQLATSLGYHKQCQPPTQGRTPTPPTTQSPEQPDSIQPQPATVESPSPLPTVGAGILPDREHRHDPFPMTEIQAAYYVGRESSLQLGNVATHVYEEIDCPSLDVARLQAAWQRLIERHDMLRAVILVDGNIKVLDQPPTYRIKGTDLRGCPAEEVEHSLRGLRDDLSHKVRRSEEWPPFEIQAVRLDDNRVRLFFSYDVIFVDGRSRAILFDEWARLYQNPEAALPALEITFRDYVLAVVSKSDAESVHRARRYWTNRLNDLPGGPRLTLACDPASLEQPRFERRTTTLPEEDWTLLKKRAARSNITPSAALLTAFSDVLRRWSESPAFTLNLSLFNRRELHPQVNYIIGDFTSVTLLEVEDPEGRCFAERSRRLQRQLWQDLDHHQVSGIEVQRLLRRQRRDVEMPVVFTSLLWNDASTNDRRSSKWLGKRVYGVSQTPQVWIDCVVREDDGALVVIWDAVESLFPAGMLDCMFEAFIQHLVVLSTEETGWSEAWRDTARRLVPLHHAEMFEAFNDTEAAVSHQLLHELFLDQAGKSPDEPALISASGLLTYGELDELSNRLACRLKSLGAQPNTLVAVVMDKGWEQIVAVLGILKAGAAYLPIDAGLPAERLQKLFRHGEVTIALTQGRHMGLVEWPEGVEPIALSQEELSGFPLAVPASPVCAEDLAYVIYTSGSTGEPKGVMIDHRGAVNTILDINSRFGVRKGDRVLALSSLSFDLSVYDIFGCLAAGATIVIAEAEGTRDPSHWADLVNRHGVTVWNSVPALMELLVDYLRSRPEARLRSLKLVLLSGDWIPVALPDAIRSASEAAQLVSLGGATEASIWSILYPIDRVDPHWTSIPYGRPMRNQTFHVLDAHLLPCPIWVPGELFIGGTGLAKGYWRDQERSQASFFVHPRTGERLYRTGDMGRYLPDGNIEFLGRKDTQVKLQGYRAELGEIEATLSRHPGVSAVAVIVKGQRHGSKRLVAYVVAKRNQPAAPSELQAFLRQKLPDYMVPATYILLDAMPLTANGKVNRQALPEPPEASVSSEHEEAPQRGSLSQMRQLVAEVLGQDDLDTQENLLERGANSIDMIRIVNRIDEALGFRPRIGDLYRDPTIAGLTRSYEEYRRDLGIRALEGDAPNEPAGNVRVLTDPDEREAFKSTQAGLRRFAGEVPSIALITAPVDEATIRQYAQRRSYRNFSTAPVPFSQLSGLLGRLSPIRVEGYDKYLFGSAGSSYPVQTYVYAKPGRVESLPAGVYYYQPAERRFMLISGGACVDPEIYDVLINRPVFDAAAFAVFFVAQLGAIQPLYGEYSISFVTIEAGLMTQLLEMTAPSYSIGLCQMGGLDSALLRGPLAFEPGHVLVHSLVGGLIANLAAQEQQAADTWMEGEI